MIMIMIRSATLWFAGMAYRLVGPTGTGFASRADIARDLSAVGLPDAGQGHPA